MSCELYTQVCKKYDTGKYIQKLEHMLESVMNCFFFNVQNCCYMVCQPKFSFREPVLYSYLSMSLKVNYCPTE